MERKLLTQTKKNFWCRIFLDRLWLIDHVSNVGSWEKRSVLKSVLLLVSLLQSGSIRRSSWPGRARRWWWFRHRRGQRRRRPRDTPRSCPLTTARERPPAPSENATSSSSFLLADCKWFLNNLNRLNHLFNTHLWTLCRKMYLTYLSQELRWWFFTPKKCINSICRFFAINPLLLT